jgi:hypothetical protein
MAQKHTDKNDKAAKAATPPATAGTTDGQTVSLATQGTQALAEVDTDYEDEASKGFENQDLSMVRIPRLDVLQSSSKVIKQPKAQRHPALKDAEPGMLYNTVTRELIDGEKGLEIIPVQFRKRYYLRNDDMEHRGVLLPDDPQVAKALREGSFGNYYVDREEDGKVERLEMIETIELFVTYTSPSTGGTHAAVMTLQSTKIPVFKDWNTGVSGYRMEKRDGSKYSPPLYANRTIVRTEYDPGKKDQAYYKLVMEPAVKDSAGVPQFKLSLNPKSDMRYAVATKLLDDLLDMKVDADRSDTAGTGETRDRGDKRNDGGF